MPMSLSEGRDVRFVKCPSCEGYGAYIVGHGRWPDGSENNEERPCEECNGEGVVEQAVEPLTMEDALRLDAEKLEALSADEAQP